MKNQFGIEICECCASCRFKDLTRLISARFCTEHQRCVKPGEHCEQWAMSEQMEAAGSGRGIVKKKAYLKYVLEVREDERLRVGERSSGISLADQLGLQLPHKTLIQIREEFEQKSGSIFLSL